MDIKNAMLKIVAEDDIDDSKDFLGIASAKGFASAIESACFEIESRASRELESAGDETFDELEAYCEKSNLNYDDALNIVCECVHVTIDSKKITELAAEYITVHERH